MISFSVKGDGVREHGVVEAVQRKAAIKVQHRLDVTVDQSVFCAMKGGICDRVCRSLGGIRVFFFGKREVHVKQLQYGTVAATGRKVQFADGIDGYWACLIGRPSLQVVSVLISKC